MYFLIVFFKIDFFKPDEEQAYLNSITNTTDNNWCTTFSCDDNGYITEM